MGRKKTAVLFLLTVFLTFALWPSYAMAMHIMEGFLPPAWAAGWWVVVLPFLLYGLWQLRRVTRQNPRIKILLGLAGAFAFVLSALKIPSVTGSCSHPTGVGLAAVLFGPAATSVIGFIVLFFQALLLAHGGLTTLGANAFSMAVAGPVVSYFVYRLTRRASPAVAVFLAAMLGDLATYLVTSLQLALAYPATHGGVLASLVKFAGIFAVTQIPLAISEGLLTALVFNFLREHNRNELMELSVISGEGGSK